MRTLNKLLLAAALVAAPLAARAEVLDFDDLPSVGAAIPLPQAYHGFDNANVYYISQGDIPGTGFDAGAVSAPNDVFNGFGGLASLTSVTAFTLNDGWFTQGFGPTTVTISGRTVAGGAVDFTKTFTTSMTPQLVTFNWTGLHELDLDGANQHFVIDDLRVNEATPVTGGVPEPATWAMLLMGLGGLGGLLRTRRRTQPEATAA